MRHRGLVIAFCLATVISGVGTVAADTRSPSTQTFVLECGGSTVTVVSPVFASLAAQVVGTTGVGVLKQALFTDGSGTAVVFESPSFQALDSSTLTTCTWSVPEGTFTLVMLMTPQGRRHP